MTDLGFTKETEAVPVYYKLRSKIQKASFYAAKGCLLRCKRAPFRS